MASDASHIERPEQYCTRRRLSAIYDARDAIPQAENNAYEMRFQGAIGDDMVALAVRKAVLHYVVELEPLLRNLDAGDEYWESAHLGVIEFPQADETLAVVGLEHFVSLPDVLTAEFAEIQDDVFYGPQTVTKPEHRPVPKHISLAAYRTANQFCYEANIGVDLGERDVTDPNPV